MRTRLDLEQPNSAYVTHMGKGRTYRKSTAPLHLHKIYVSRGLSATAEFLVLSLIDS